MVSVLKKFLSKLVLKNAENIKENNRKLKEELLNNPDVSEEQKEHVMSELAQKKRACAKKHGIDEKDFE